MFKLLEVGDFAGATGKVMRTKAGELSIEVRSLGEAFGASHTMDRPLWIGSVKTNIGHLDTAAGVASLIKVCLGLRHEVIPPTVNHEKPNPLIDFANSPFFVAAERRAWPRGERTRFAGVTSLGVGLARVEFYGKLALLVVGELKMAAGLRHQRAHLVVADEGGSAAAPMQLGHRAVGIEQIRLQGKLPMQALQIGTGAAAVFGQHLVGQNLVR